MEPNKKLAREHGTKPGQIAIKGAISQPDLTGSRERPQVHGEARPPEGTGPRKEST